MRLMQAFPGYMIQFGNASAAQGGPPSFSPAGSKPGFMILKILLLMALFICGTAGDFTQDYPSGIVASVVDGDSFNVQDYGLVSLAGVDCPEMGGIEGVHAREYSLERLLNVVVYLDTDDQAGVYPDGGIPCLVYLSRPDGGPDLNKSYNRMIVDAGYAVVRSRPPSEFSPALFADNQSS